MDAAGDVALGEGGGGHGAADDDAGHGDQGAHVAGKGGESDDDADGDRRPNAAGHHDGDGRAGQVSGGAYYWLRMAQGMAVTLPARSALTGLGGRRRLPAGADRLEYETLPCARRSASYQVRICHAPIRRIRTPACFLEHLFDD